MRILLLQKNARVPPLDSSAMLLMRFFKRRVLIALRCPVAVAGVAVAAGVLQGLRLVDELAHGFAGRRAGWSPREP